MIKTRSETRALVTTLATIGLAVLNAAHAESKSDSCFAFGDNQQITCVDNSFNLPRQRKAKANGRTKTRRSCWTIRFALLAT